MEKYRDILVYNFYYDNFGRVGIVVKVELNYFCWNWF